MLEFDFPITTRISSRAKRINAYVKPHGIEVALPNNTSLEDAYPLLIKHQIWLKQKWDELVEKQQQKLIVKEQTDWPVELNLPMLDKKLIITTQQLEQLFYLSIGKHRIALGKSCPKINILYFIKLWFIDQSHQSFLALLNYHSNKMKLEYKALEIKWLKSCWGSCSHVNKITLNAILLFFQQDIIEYVIIHELAHIKHKNHSKSFWKLVARYCPNYVMIKQKLHEESKQLPLWLYDSKYLPNIILD